MQCQFLGRAQKQIGQCEEQKSNKDPSREINKQREQWAFVKSGDDGGRHDPSLVWCQVPFRDQFSSGVSSPTCEVVVQALAAQPKQQG